MTSRRIRIILLLLGGVGLSACATVGNIDTAAMQTTNRAVGAPLNGPGNPPSPRPQPGL